MNINKLFNGSLLAGTRGNFVGALGSDNREILIPPPNIPLRVGFIGTSLVQMNNYLPATGLANSAAGWFNWAQVLTDQLLYAPVWPDSTYYAGWEPNGSGTRGFRGYNAGVNGQKFAQIMARKEYFVDTYNANIIIIDMGTNDIGISTKEDIQAARENLALYYLGQGKSVILLPILMRDVTGSSVSGLPQWQTGGVGRKHAEWCNERSRNFAKNYPNLYFYDWNQQWLDWTTAATQTQGVPKSGYTIDGTHMSVQGAYAIGKNFAAFMQKILPVNQPRVWSPSNLFDATENPFGNIFSNAPLIGTAGALTNATGTVATGCTVTGSANCATVATAQTARSDGLGYWQQLAITPGGVSTGTVVFKPTGNITHGLNNGDWYQASIKIACDGNASLTDLAVKLQDGSIGTNIVWGHSTPTGSGALPTEAWSGTILTPPLQVQSSTVCILQVQLNIAATGTATTVQIGSIELRKIENPQTYTAVN